MDHLKTNPYSHLTAKERDSLSFPARMLLNVHKLVGEVLDFGCGFGTDVAFLKERGISITGYDKHYFPDYPQKKFDTILCFYVLNVLKTEEQAQVLMEVSSLLKPTGKAYFAVRRDLTFKGFRTHKIYQKPTYQCIVKLNYPSIFKNENCELYEYQHYTQVYKPARTNCPFCHPDKDRELIVESATAYSIYDKFPVSEGHALIIPKKHYADYFELSFKEQSACWFMVNHVKQLLVQKHHPDGFNVGININAPAGQTISHAHIHLIPRYMGDVERPEGGVRGIIPGKKEY